MKTYVSNTTASGANQFFFNSSPTEMHTCRVFYRVSQGGTYPYALSFANRLDSTYADGSVGQANLPCKPWVIHSLRLAPCGGVTEEDLPFVTVAREVTVEDTFSTESTALAVDSYLCMEMTFSGTMIPSHEETLLPILEKTSAGWASTKKMPLPGMVAVLREVEKRIGYVGDSITQGIGTPVDSYTHWNALVSKKLGNAYAYHNLGIGYARAHDLASMGAWMDKAMANDVIVLCLGANDLLQGYPEEQIKKDLHTLVTAFKAAGKTLLLQAVPPFEYPPETLETWERVNVYLQGTLAPLADGFFDPATVLTSDGKTPLYGGHPNETGCALWAEALYPKIKKLL